MDLTKALNSVGRAVFVKYFYVFMNMPVEDCLEMFTESYTEKSKKNRINNAKKIFREELQRDALRLIFNSPKVNAALRKKARRIYSVESRKRSFGVL